MASIDLSDYIPVSERIARFKELFPEGRLQSEVVDTGVVGFVAVKAYAYRSPEDTLPGVGLAWEPVPGPTPYTKNSELQNAETSAWGRALIAALIADSSKGIASRDEIAARESHESKTPTPWVWVWNESAVFKAWTVEERTEAARVAMQNLAFSEEPKDMDEARSILEHMRGQYESRPDEGLPLEAAE